MAKKPKKLLFTLILIGLLTSGPGCSENKKTNVDTNDTEMDSGADTSGDVDTDVDTDTDGDSDSDSDSDADSDSDGDSDSDAGSDHEELIQEICDGFGDVHQVPSPPDGITPNPENLCAVDTQVVTSNKAATVTLTIDSEDYYSPNWQYLATGQIILAEGIGDRIVGIPVIEVIQSEPAELTDATITDIETSQDGFTFNIAFPNETWIEPGEAEVIIQVTFELTCGDASSDTQMVESATFLHLCHDAKFPPIWVSSGGECAVCYEVCEKIASPLPALRDTGPAALSGSPRAEIVPVAHYGRSLVLFVEHRDTKGPLSYHWKVSGGDLTGEDQAGVIWKLPHESGPHLIQVAIKDSTSAVVTTMSWQHKA